MEAIKIGTRESKLAIWQGKKVQEHLTNLGLKSELIFIKSEGDINLTTPLYQLGVQGIFTKALDIALLKNEIDIAVHSYKDVPTTLAEGTKIVSVLERDDYHDYFISKDEVNFSTNCIIGTSSVRRTAQWLHRFPHHITESIRGNIHTRLDKFMESNLSGFILSKAGVDRVELAIPKGESLEWMLPAPSQGTIVVTALKTNQLMQEVCSQFNHEQTAICTKVEKDFLKHLMGGCSTPIAALAKIQHDKIYFQGNIFSLDGTTKAEIEVYFAKEIFEEAGEIAAEKIKQNGGFEILKKMKLN